MQTDSGYLAAAARRCGIQLDEPKPIWECDVRASDNVISRVREVAQNDLVPAMDGHAVATWFGIACLSAIAMGVLLAL